jgi:cation diffusion facilitator CzcD-associated flavoprotein CzcO
MTAVTLPPQIDIAIIGGGPHALTLVTHLLQKRKTMRGRFLVFDPSGTWMQQWNHQFAAQQIPHLRSPAVHHPDPDPHALRTFAQNRPNELFPPYDLPGTTLFKDFCQDLIQRWQLQNCVYPAEVIAIKPRRQKRRSQFDLELSNGQTLIARRVVLANGSGLPHYPTWVKQISTSYPQQRLLHSHQVDLRKLQLQGEQILIIGGGQTSGHLALGAIERGANVILMNRRTFYHKLFDAEPGWLGPKYLKGFWAETNWFIRWQMIQQARNGGSMTPPLLSHLRQLEQQGRIKFYQQCQVSQAQWMGNYWQIYCDQITDHSCIHQQKIDQIWLATGSQINATEHPLLSEILTTYPTEIVNGLPVLDQNLRLPQCEFFIMGGLAALQVGPTARNLSGARMASARIVQALIKPTKALI